MPQREKVHLSSSGEGGVPGRSPVCSQYAPCFGRACPCMWAATPPTAIAASFRGYPSSVTETRAILPASGGASLATVQRTCRTAGKRACNASMIFVATRSIVLLRDGHAFADDFVDGQVVDGLLHGVVRGDAAQFGRNRERHLETVSDALFEVVTAVEGVELHALKIDRVEHRRMQYGAIGKIPLRSLPDCDETYSTVTR